MLLPDEIVTPMDGRDWPEEWPHGGAPTYGVAAIVKIQCVQRAPNGRVQGGRYTVPTILDHNIEWSGRNL